MKKKAYAKKCLCLVLTLMTLCFPVSASAAGATVSYKAHCQNYGWMSPVHNGTTCGTTGQGLRLEALQIQVAGMPGGISYRTHIQNIGWQGWKSNGQMAGTTGQGLRVEAIEIKLTGQLATCFDVQYRTHVENIGWQGWKSNGQMAGTTGQGLRVEAIEIKLTPKAGNTSTMSNRQQAMANQAKAMLGSTNYNGYCQRFVRVVAENIGVTGASASSALEACNKWRVSTSMDNIPVGATVYLRSKNTSSAGYTYGHVGIYVGNGQVVHAVNQVKMQSLSSMLNSFTYLGWGWQAGVDLR